MWYDLFSGRNLSTGTSGERGQQEGAHAQGIKRPGGPEAERGTGHALQGVGSMKLLLTPKSRRQPEGSAQAREGP